MAVIHSLSPGFEDQVSGVRREERKNGNPKPETLYETTYSWNSEPQNNEYRTAES
jgi:hypothetical protein